MATWGGIDVGQALGSSTIGSVLIVDTSNLLAQVTPGTAGYVLTSAGAGAAPTWQPVTASAGGSDSQAQFNSSGTLAGSAALRFLQTIGGQPCDVTVTSQGNTHTAMQIVGAASQSVDLTVWMSSGGSTLARVEADGNLGYIRSVGYVWPTSNASGVLTNDGSGNLSWSATGTVTSVATTGSLTGGTITTTGTLSLVNDNASPGNSYYYGTDSGGTKGFFALPTGTVTSITAGTGLTGGAITTSGTIALDVAHANTWTAQQSFTDGTNSVALADGTHAVTVSAGHVTVLGTTGSTYRWANSVAAPTPTASAPSFSGYFGGGTNGLGDPDAWVLVRIGSTDYKIPLYLA